MLGGLCWRYFEIENQLIKVKVHFSGLVPLSSIEFNSKLTNLTLHFSCTRRHSFINNTSSSKSKLNIRKNIIYVLLGYHRQKKIQKLILVTIKVKHKAKVKSIFTVYLLEITFVEYDKNS